MDSDNDFAFSGLADYALVSAIPHLDWVQTIERLDHLTQIRPRHKPKEGEVDDKQYFFCRFSSFFAAF
jgi:hypothetical protein